MVLSREPDALVVRYRRGDGDQLYLDHALELAAPTQRELVGRREGREPELYHTAFQETKTLATVD